jgi:hypothetical protein
MRFHAPPLPSTSATLSLSLTVRETKRNGASEASVFEIIAYPVSLIEGCFFFFLFMLLKILVGLNSFFFGIFIKLEMSFVEN